jgi:hypothetical protein
MLVILQFSKKDEAMIPEPENRKRTNGITDVIWWKWQGNISQKQMVGNTSLRKACSPSMFKGRENEVN